MLKQFLNYIENWKENNSDIELVIFCIQIIQGLVPVKTEDISLIEP